MIEGENFEIVYKVTPDVYQGFIHTFEDKNPLHTDKEFAMAKGFKSVVMHGGILTGFLSNFVGEKLPEKNVIIHSYSIQFVKPVYLHTELLLKATVSEVYESVKCVIILYKFFQGEDVVSKGKLNLGII